MSLKKFYVFGALCFLVIGGANLWGFITKIKAGLPLWALIVAGGGVALNLGFSYFFYWLSTQQQGPPLESFDFSEVDNMFKEAKR